MPSDFGFMKYSDPLLQESSRNFFIPLTSSQRLQMRFLDISAITEQERDTQQVEGQCACNTLGAHWEFLFSSQDLLFL